MNINMTATKKKKREIKRKVSRSEVIKPEAGKKEGNAED